MVVSAVWASVLSFMAMESNLALFSQMEGSASVFSAFKSVRSQGQQLNTALALPAYSTPYALKQAAAGVSSGVMDYLIAQAINTVLTSLKDELRRAKFRPLLVRLRDALNATVPDK